MSEQYKIGDPNSLYFITMTVVDWIDVFTRKNYRETIINSLNYCQKAKGLEIYSYCIMSSHIHMIIRAKEGYNLSEILRDFKKYTSKKIIKQIQEEAESRRSWMLERFEAAGKDLKRIKYYKFWQDGNHPKELVSNEFTDQKLEYIHNNPVEAMIVSKPEEYIWSSASNYADMGEVLKVISINDGVEI